MCKFTNRLFVFPLLLTLLYNVAAGGVARRLRGGGGGGGVVEERLSLADLLPTSDYDYNYDLDYDQRQKGNDNMRLKMDGIFIAMPAQEANVDELWEELSEDLLQSFVKSHSSTVAPEKSQLSYRSDTLKSLAHKTNAERKSNVEPLIVEIPALKRESRITFVPIPELEARNAQGSMQQRAAAGVVLDANAAEGGRARSPGKRHFYSLLNLMKRLRRN